MSGADTNQRRQANDRVLDYYVPYRSLEGNISPQPRSALLSFAFRKRIRLLLSVICTFQKAATVQRCMYARNLGTL
jgi:hypothetical protein